VQIASIEMGLRGVPETIILPGYVEVIPQQSIVTLYLVSCLHIMMLRVSCEPFYRCWSLFRDCTSARSPSLAVRSVSHFRYEGSSIQSIHRITIVPVSLVPLCMSGRNARRWRQELLSVSFRL
jgi:hypothetical protein